MGKYVIVPKPTFESDEIIAESPEEAMDKFAAKHFTCNLYDYFVPVKDSELEVEKHRRDIEAHERIVKGFMRDQLELEYNVPEKISSEYAELAYEFYCDEYGTEGECIEKAYDDYVSNQE